ncbi:hypothetical protein [Halocatena halophila]|uniref:hypothetical protein n=1 Tax=Halocatena halophila TaxID=2814576 RepID=UPI002ED025F8
MRDTSENALSSVRDRNLCGFTRFVVVGSPVQIGVGEAEQVLCSGPISIAQLITIGLGLISTYLIIKGVLRLMMGVDNAGATELVGSDGIRRTKAAPAYGRRQARGGIYSVLAALLPTIVPVLLGVAGINVVSCLFP